VTPRDWMSGGVVENDAEELRTARDHPLPQHREHPFDCLCRQCCEDKYDPAAEARS
jgi:hypothetical protein